MSWYRFICTFILSIKMCSVVLECCVADLLSEHLEVICSGQAYAHKQDNRTSGQPWQLWTSLFTVNLEDVVSAQVNLGLLSVHIPVKPLPALTVYWWWCPHKLGLIPRTMNWKIYLKINLAPVSKMAVRACMAANCCSFISSVELACLLQALSRSGTHQRAPVQHLN